MSVVAYTYRLAVIGLFVVFVASVGMSSQETTISPRPNAPVAFNAASTPIIEFSLPNLVCDDAECALAVKDILARQPGAKDVLVDVEAKTATVAIESEKFDSALALAELAGRGFELELATAAEFNPAGAPTLEFAVPDMMCEEGCAAAVREILAERPGVKDVRVDFASKSATVAIVEGTFDSQLAIAELVDKGFGNAQLKSDSSEGAPSGPPAAQ